MARLKKIYSVLNEAVKLSELENGEVASWNYNTDGQIFFDTYFMKYVKYTKKELNTQQYKYLNGSIINDEFLASGASYAFTLAGGETILIQNYVTNGYKVIAVDINGYQKPNQSGKDVFLFNVGNLTRGKVLPFGYSIDRNTLLNTRSRYYCNVNSPVSGFMCSAVIMHDDWQIKDDYPW